MTHQEKESHGLLEVESAYYESNRDDLLMRFPNRFLLIHGENLEGHFETMDDAITEGVLRFGSEPFLIRRSGDSEPVLSAPSLVLGILRCQ